MKADLLGQPVEGCGTHSRVTKTIHCDPRLVHSDRAVVAPIDNSVFVSRVARFHEREAT
jgi:hypothetical protein